MKRIVIFASGSGTNAENIINYSRQSNTFEVAKVYCNNPTAGIILRASKLDVPVEIFSKKLFHSNLFVNELLKNKVDFIVLAGFLWLFPELIIEKFENKVINIHPALLPKFGGKGMYGMNVHNAVKANGETETGITIHLVSKEYDKGEIIFQASCFVFTDDTPDSIAAKVHQLEYEHFPRVIDSFVNN